MYLYIYSLLSEIITFQIIKTIGKLQYIILNIFFSKYCLFYNTTTAKRLIIIINNNNLELNNGNNTGFFSTVLKHAEAAVDAVGQ